MIEREGRTTLKYTHQSVDNEMYKETNIRNSTANIIDSFGIHCHVLCRPVHSETWLRGLYMYNVLSNS